MGQDSLQENCVEPIRHVLQAALTLAAHVGFEEARNDGTRSTIRSTRILINLMESWCVDRALRTRHLALSDLAPEECSDAAVLAALRRYFDLDRPAAEHPSQGADHRTAPVARAV